MLAIVPTENKSRQAAGSSTEASCWVARNIFFSPANASSSARTPRFTPHHETGVII